MFSFVSGPSPQPMCLPTTLTRLEEVLGEAAVDDRDARPGVGAVVPPRRLIADLEVAAGEHRDVHGLEVAGRQGVHERLHVLAVGRLVALDRHRAVPFVAGEDGDRRGARGADARDAPGCARAAGSGSSCRARRRSRSGSGRPGTTMRFSGSRTPVSVPRRFCRLRVKSPAPKSSRKLRATCAATSPLRRNSDWLPPAIEPTVSLSVFHGSGRLARSAGSRPKTMPVTSVTVKAKPRIAQVGRRLDQQRAAFGRDEREQRPGEEHRQRDADDAAEEREDQALDQELADQLTARGADREPDRDLPLAQEAAGDEQVGDVAAGDQQHEADHARAGRSARCGTGCRRSE